MCLCHEFNKRFSPNGLYQGRVVQATIGKNVKLVSPQAMVKQTTQMYKRYGKNK
ncbi:hypothetical protein [Bacillus sp. MRMR6]|uniref:hypothetical protein n=1 Tax=Bacillus sp. MRMR6 TaxID=1928617 RepID=UPI00158D147F|nr:hypothetical protein [Bacillus sp. MRMR6]